MDKGQGSGPHARDAARALTRLIQITRCEAVRADHILPALRGEPRLFHYTRRDTAVRHILPSASLRLGGLPHTNDPREFEPVLFSMRDDVGGASLDTNAFFGMIREADERLRSSCRLACLTEDRPDFMGTGVSSYGNGPARARMWAQYAENHAGVCLCFERARLLAAATADLQSVRGLQLFHAPVTYRTSVPTPEAVTARELLRSRMERDPEAYIEDLLVEHVNEFFFVKNWDWSSETEYRIVVRGDTRAAEFIDVRDALEAVILGPRFPTAAEAAIAAECKRLRIRAHRLYWRNGQAVILPGPDTQRR